MHSKTPQGLISNQDWKSIRFKFLMERRNRPVREDDSVVTAFRDGVVTLRSNRREDGFTFAEREIGYQGVEPGDLLIHGMDAFAGAIGVSDSRGKCSPVCTVLTPRPSVGADTRYWGYYLRSLARSGYITSLAKGIRERTTDFRWRDAGNLVVPVAPLETQVAIADFLDHESALLDRLIEKKQRISAATAEYIEALVSKAIASPDAAWVRFEHITQRYFRVVELSKQDELVRLGLYNRGRGIFKKPAADEEEMGSSNFSFVRTGDLIISGQFAWEGAVAIASIEEDGCVVSHRYPLYRGAAGVKTPYVLGVLRSGFGAFLLNEASRGSAGRNRPLNTWRLGKEKIPVPGEPLQDEVSRAVAFERRVREKNAVSVQKIKDFRAALITAAVTGQIDVTTWGKQGQTDRCLDKIHEEMGV
jgi:type I restriction enzyme S subunit